MKESLDRSFLRMDDQLRCMGAYTNGSTASVCVVKRENGNRVIYTANVSILQNSTQNIFSYIHFDFLFCLLVF